MDAHSTAKKQQATHSIHNVFTSLYNIHNIHISVTPFSTSAPLSQSSPGTCAIVIHSRNPCMLHMQHTQHTCIDGRMCVLYSLGVAWEFWVACLPRCTSRLCLAIFCSLAPHSLTSGTTIVRPLRSRTAAAADATAAGKDGWSEGTLSDLSPDWSIDGMSLDGDAAWLVRSRSESQQRRIFRRTTFCSWSKHVCTHV